MKLSKRTKLLLLTPIALLALLVLMAGGFQGFLRGLTTNVAVTSPEADDSALRPLETSKSTDAIEAAITNLSQSSRQWSLAETVKPLPADSPLRQAIAQENLDRLPTWHLVHASGLIGFRDDVWVIAQPIEQRHRLLAHSESRLGKGDLGQNPRNLRALHKELSKRL